MKKVLMGILVLLVMLSLVSCTATSGGSTTNKAPEKASSPTPADKSEYIVYYQNLSWEGFDIEGDPLTYNLYFGKSETPELEASDLNECSYNLLDLDLSTTYYWRVDTIDSNGNITKGDLWSFTTEDPSIYKWSDISLEENYYTYLSIPIEIAETSTIHGIFELSDWSEDYNLELILLKDTYFEDFKNGINNFIWNENIKTKDTYKYSINNVEPGSYRLIVDNSDLGYELTDTDENNDIAYFNMSAYQKIQ